ncbi:MAG: amidohydrolase family protein, partial [Chloroflexi bacterium]|nr:amidohydrolase family protein [Chloroflexota bacterium]
VSAQLAYKKEKSWGKPFNQLPGGMAQIETRPAVVFSEGVSRGRMTINRWVEAMSTAPARIFGLYPRKGIIAPGSDADIVVYDPSVRRTLTNRDLHQGTDYTVFEDLELLGQPVMTMLRGKVIVENGTYVGSTGQGLFLPRSIARDVLERPVV